MLAWKIHTDGTIDLIYGSLLLSGGYPAVDGVTVHPLKVESGENEVSYFMDGAFLHLALSAEGERVLLRCTVDGLDKAHDISPLAGLRLGGCDRIFSQGEGMGSSCGFHKADANAEPDVIRKEKLWDSFAVVAVGNSSEVIAACVPDETRYQVHFPTEMNRLDMVLNTEATLQGKTQLPVIELTAGSDFDAVLRGCAYRLADFMHARTPDISRYHWCSWYYLYHTLDQPTLEEYVREFPKYEVGKGFSHIQIDAGYFNSCGDWLDPSPRFPKGLKYAADTIKAAGYEPGLWIGPYMVGEESRIYHEHPEWMLRDTEGKLVTPWRWYNEPKVWGYRDAEYFVPDFSIPEAREWIVNVFRTLHEWGFTLFKTDFMWWGLQDSTKVVRHCPGKTSFEYFRMLLQDIREAIGEDSIWLGCIAPFAPFIGYADSIRIGGDVCSRWLDDENGNTYLLEEIRGCQYFNNIYWQNDPDAMILRDFHLYLKPNEVECLALLQGASGGSVNTSDPIHRMGEDRRELLAMLRPNGVHHPVFLDWADNKEVIGILNHIEGAVTLYYMNPTASEKVVLPDWAKLSGYEAPCAWQWRGAQGTPAAVVLPPHSGKLFFITEKPLDHCPTNLWSLD